MTSHEHTAEHDDHGIAHVASKKVLLSTITVLLVLTVATVMATWWDFGRQINLLIAMVIATVKAGLVAMFFMHLRYDKKFHTVVILSALLFAILFVGFSLMDTGAYLDEVIWDTNNPPSNP